MIRLLPSLLLLLFVVPVYGQVPSGLVEITGKSTGAVVGESVAVRCVNAGNTAFESCAGAGASGLTDAELRATPVPVSGTITANQGGTWTVQPGNTANTTAWKVDGSAVTQPVSGTVTANAGTNLNTSTLLTTTAHDAAFGTAGTADAQVRSVQGIASGTPVGVQSNGANLATEASLLLTLTSANFAAAFGTAGTADSQVMSIQGIASMTPVNTNNTQIAGSTVVADPCQVNAKTYGNISQTAGTQIITGTASKRVYFCSFNVVAAAAQNLSVVAGTGTVCATTTVAVPGLSGGATAATGWNFAANGGIVLGNGQSAITKTTVDADNVCILQSGSAQLSGGFSYVVQ